METHDRAEARLARKVRIGQLLQIYGSLLTARQKEFMRLYYCEDMSFGEIGGEFSVSRQAVHDAVKQAEAAMEGYEAGLGLLARGGWKGPVEPKPASIEPAFLESAISKLRQIRKQMVAQRVIYDTGDFVRIIDEVLNDLGTFSGEA